MDKSKVEFIGPKNNKNNRENKKRIQAKAKTANEKEILNSLQFGAKYIWLKNDSNLIEEQFAKRRLSFQSISRLIGHA